MAEGPDRDHRARLRLLDGFGLETAGGAPVAIPGRRARGLLAFLYLARGQTAGRERLCGLLWSDRAEPQARSSLRQCLFELRNLLLAAGLDILDIGRADISLRGQAVTSDHAELREALDRPETGPLVEALGRMGRGRLLDDVEVPGLFQDWLVQTRAEFEQSLASRIHARLADLEAEKRWPDVRAVAEALLSRDPLDEAAAAAAIRADGALGAVAAAHRRFQALRNALVKELDVAPGAAVRAAMAGLAGVEAAGEPPTTEPVTAIAFGQRDGDGRIGEGAGRSGEAAAPPRPAILGGGRPTLAVLSFDLARGEPDQAYLAQGIAEDIAAALIRLKWLFVLSPRSSLNYSNSVANVGRIRQDLGVRYIVHGKITCANNRIRLTVHLSDCMLGDTVFSRHFDGLAADVFSIQDETVAAVVGALEPALFRREEEAIPLTPLRNLEHWDLFIRGRWHFWQLTYRNVAAAQSFLTKALALKPDDPQTLALLAFTHTVQLWSGWAPDPDATLAKAKGLALRAVRVGPDDAFARYTLGCALTLTGELDRAIAEQARALEINPNFAGAMGELGRYFAYSGDYDQAIAWFDRAIRTSPTDPQLFLWLRHKAVAAFTSGRLAGAVAFAREAVTCRADVSFNHYLLAALLAANGEVTAAKESFAEAQRLLPTYSSGTMKFSNPFRRPEDMARYVVALRRCGWTG